MIVCNNCFITHNLDGKIGVHECTGWVSGEMCVICGRIADHRGHYLTNRSVEKLLGPSPVVDDPFPVVDYVQLQKDRKEREIQAEIDKMGVSGDIWDSFVMLKRYIAEEVIKLREQIEEL